MKVIQINLGNYGSTGGIAIGINEVAKAEGIETYFAYPWDSNNKPSKERDIIIGNEFGRRASRKLGKITGYNGCFSVFATVKFLNKLNKIKPDIIHLHNLHNCYINLPMFFYYIKKKKVPVVWTLHDCWAFTGRCPHFQISGCGRWKTGCYDCPYPKSEYPSAWIDRSKILWKMKKGIFTGVNNMIIVTPSKWLAELVEESFLSEYPVKVINNGIDLSVFQPTPSDFREKHHISTDKFVLLGVAFGWGKKKGLDVFVELSKWLNPNKYQIVLVGTDEETDRQLPGPVLSVHRTQNQKGLAEIYTAADLFVNPTREDNYPTVNMEAISCGTPVLTFRTGGSPESVNEETGRVVEYEDINGLKKEIVRLSAAKTPSAQICAEYSAKFNQKNRFEEYLELYKEWLNTSDMKV